MSVKFITNREHYEDVIMQITKARKFVWIGTADIKDLHVKHKGNVVSFLSVLNELVRKKSCRSLASCKRAGCKFQKKF